MLFYQHPSKKLRNIISESRCLGDLIWAFATRRAFRYIFFRYAPKGCRSNP